MKLSQRVKTVVPSATLAMTARAQALRAAGTDVLLMSAGEPDFDTPENIKKAARAAIDRGESKYTPVSGSAALRTAVAESISKFYEQTFKPNNVIVGAGGKQVLFNAMAVLVDPGDEVLFGAPYWVSYPDMVRFNGGVPVTVLAREKEGFLPQAADFAGHITSRTRVIILNSPCNPTGAAYTRSQLMDIAEVLRKHPNIFIITDDIYSGLVYDEPFVGISHVAPDLASRILIATGASKTYAMTGWRIGYGIGPTELVAAMNDLQGASTSGACSIAQAGAVEAVAGSQDAVIKMREVFKARRDRIVAGLRNIPKLELFAPKGAFYVFPRITAFLGNRCASSSALCEHLLEHAHIALVPGAAFGSDDHIRLSFACSDTDIDEGVKRLAAGLKSLG